MAINQHTGKCGSCKFYEQGKTCSFCGNKAQTDKELKTYCYYNFQCNLWEEGIAQSRVKYMEKIVKENTHQASIITGAANFLKNLSK